MKQLELKHISPYLPYGLKVRRPNKTTTLKVWGMDQEPNYTFLEDDGSTSIGQISFAQNKPILRPLSLITQTITHKGETFVPLIELFSIPDFVEIRSARYEPDKKCYRVHCGYNEDIIMHELPRSVGSMQYHYVKKLHEWMFDTENLIESGLAVSTESFDIDPYA